MQSTSSYKLIKQQRLNEMFNIAKNLSLLFKFLILTFLLTIPVQVIKYTKVLKGIIDSVSPDHAVYMCRLILELNYLHI